MTYLYEKFAFDFEHSYIKHKIPVFEYNANSYIFFPKIKGKPLCTQEPLKIEIIRKEMHFYKTVT